MDSGESVQKTVLVVDDYDEVRLVTRRALEAFGYRVLEAASGAEAVRVAQADAPDLILMDISIPRMDGWEATRVLRNDPLTRDIPIIALTAHALADDRERAAEVGFTSYLAKPIEPRAVVAEIRRWIGDRTAKKTLGD